MSTTNRVIKHTYCLRLSPNRMAALKLEAGFRRISINSLIEEAIGEALKVRHSKMWQEKSDERYVPSANIEEESSDPSPETA